MLTAATNLRFVFIRFRGSNAVRISFQGTAITKQYGILHQLLYMLRMVFITFAIMTFVGHGAYAAFAFFAGLAGASLSTTSAPSTGPESLPLAVTSRSTNSMMAIGALSP